MCADSAAYLQPFQPGHLSEEPEAQAAFQQGQLPPQPQLYTAAGGYLWAPCCLSQGTCLLHGDQISTLTSIKFSPSPHDIATLEWHDAIG